MPICIGNFGINLPHGTPTNVSGFGDTVNREADDPFQAAEQLHSVDLLIIDSTICQNWYSGDGLKIQTDQICAGHEGGGKDSCVGDSGGPLVKSATDPDSGSYYWYQIGIVSFGFECAKPKEPGIYASVSFHNDWIRSSLKHYDNNFA